MANLPRSGLSPEEAAARVLTTLGDPSVRDIAVIPDPSDNPGGLPWVRVHLGSDAGAEVKEVWVGELVEGAVGELMHTTEPTLRDVIGGGDVVHAGPHGPSVIASLGFGSATAGMTFDSPSDSVLRARVDKVAHKFGLRVVSVETLHPLDSALAVTFVVPHGPVPWTADQLRTELQGAPVDVEGTYLELDAPSGKPLLRGGGAERMNGGGLWFAPRQDDRFGWNYG